MKITELRNYIKNGELNNRFSELYGSENVEMQQKRYLKAIDGFVSEYSEDRDVNLFSVAGRSELSGNHTDHNRGKVIAGAINLDIIAVASKTTENEIRLKSEGFSPDFVSLDDLSVKEEQKFNSNSLVRGVCDGFVKNNYKTGGFDAYTTSNVLKGSGLSSSAAFEVMVGNILNHLYNGGTVSNVEIAKISQYAENVHFGKASGLMDQMACAVGGFINIDFKDNKTPVINKIDFDLDKYGYYLFIVNTGGNHSDLSDEYSAVPFEMKKVASLLGHEVLRETSYEEIIENMPMLREKAGDRAILRAIHFINENDRVDRQSKALENDDIDSYFADVIDSGLSSFRFLQNVYTVKNVNEQGLSLALAITEQLLKNKKAAWRVHGGGFAGTIQAYVPKEFANTYKTEIEKVFGKDSCIALRVRKEGASKVL